MNTLSWLIYLADMFGKLSRLSIFVSVFSVIGILSSVIAITMVSNDSYIEDIWADFWKTAMKYFVIFTIIFAPLATIVPGKDTVLMIAASEITEKMLNNPDTKELLSAVKGKILNELKP